MKAFIASVQPKFTFFLLFYFFSLFNSLFFFSFRTTVHSVVYIFTTVSNSWLIYSAALLHNTLASLRFRIYAYMCTYMCFLVVCLNFQFFFRHLRHRLRSEFTCFFCCCLIVYQGNYQGFICVQLVIILPLHISIQTYIFCL